MKKRAAKPQKKKLPAKQPARKAAPKRARSQARPASPSAKAGGQWVSDKKFNHLQDSLREAQETIEAIRTGAVDAVVVNSGANGSQIYSLAGAEQPYRIYVEQMQEGALTISSDGLILYCNQRFADMLGAPLALVISGNITRHLAPEAWEQISTVFNASRGAVKHECLLQRASGTPLAVHLTASRLPAANQDAMCVVVTDLTEQKGQVELRLAKDVAEKASLAKDAFLAALSHELRTPLTPVLLAAVALDQKPDLPEDIRREIAMIRRNVELEARLIDDLLDLTRIAKGKLELRLAPLDLHSVLRRALEICRLDMTEKQQTLKLELDAKSVATHGDAVRLQQALWNLVRNAIKFTPPGGVISIRTGNSGSENERVWVRVRDTGIGFEPDESHKLFQAFEQGGRHITRQFGGLGLGLAISTSILEAHGGGIRAESRGPNQGATFTIELPLRATSAVAAAPASPATHAKASPRLRILLVEDHRDTRLSLQLYLQKMKHEVQAAETARQALELAGAHKFDLVISDLGLPDEGGGLAMMRELRRAHDLKGIAVSGYGMDEDIVQSRAAGFTHHLTKPISLERLKGLILDLCILP